MPQTSTAPSAPGPVPRKTIVGGCLGLAWLLAFGVWFYAQPVSGAVLRRDLLLLLPELLAANFQSSPDSSWGHLPQRFDLLACAALIVVGAGGLGALVLRVRSEESRARGGDESRGVEEWALAAGVGLSLWSLIVLGLGLCGLLSQPLLIGLLTAFAAGGWWRCGRPPLLNSRTTERSQGLSESRAPRWLARLLYGVMGLFLLAMLLGSLLPPTDFDVKEYHLEGPKEYWQAGRVMFLPHNVYTSFPFLTEMLLLSGMVVRGDWYRGGLAGQAVLMSFAVVTALGVYAVARRLAGPRAGLLAALVYLSTPWVYRISIIAYTEGGLACYIVLTCLALLRWIDSTASSASPTKPATRAAAPTAPLLLLGLLAGSAAACKYPGVLSVVIPIGLAVCARGAQRLIARQDRPAAVGKCVLMYSLGVFITFGPWLLKNLIETGNPVYPLLWSIFGGASFDAETNVGWKAAHAAPTALLHTPSLILPDLWQRVREMLLTSDWQSALIGGLAPLSLLTWRRRRGVRWMWAYVVWLVLTWCWLTHRIDRFWVPSLSVLAVLGGIGLDAVWEALRQWRAERNSPLVWAATGLFFATTALTVLFNLAFVTTGLCGFSGYLLDERQALEKPFVFGRSLEACRLAGVSPTNGKVLFVGEAAVFLADFPYVYNTVFDDSFFERWCAAPVAGRPRAEWPLRPVDDIRSEFAAHGITHVCVNWSEVLRYRLPGSYGFTDFVHPRRFDDLVAAGILEPAPTPQVTYAEWESLSALEQSTVEAWAPELRVSGPQGAMFRAVEVYRVR